MGQNSHEPFPQVSIKPALVKREMTATWKTPKRTPRSTAAQSFLGACHRRKTFSWECVFSSRVPVGLNLLKVVKMTNFIQSQIFHKFCCPPNKKVLSESAMGKRSPQERERAAGGQACE